jgi:hypothetical protein
VILSLHNPAIPLEGAAARPAVWTTIAANAHPLSSTFNAFGGESITALDAPAAEAVPEPDTLALLGGALAVFALVTLIRRKRRRK